MALQTFKRGLWLPGRPIWGNSAFIGTQLVMDASGEKVALLFEVPANGTIEKVGFRTNTVTTSDSFDVGLFTTDDTTGDPTTTAYGGMAVGTQATVASNTAYTVTLGTPATATAGDIVAIVISFTSFVAGSVQFSQVGHVNHIGQAFPYGDQFAGGSWTKANGIPVCWVEYSGGVYHPIDTMPYAAINSHAFNTGSNPDEYALRINWPFPCRAVGAWVLGGPSGTSSDWQMVLYEGVTQRAISSWDGNYRVNSPRDSYRRRFAASYEMAANTEYFLSILPTTANNVELMSINTPSAAAMDALEMGQLSYMATRQNAAGTWDADTDRRPMMGLIVDALDDGAGGGGGGGASQLINGGLVTAG